MVVTIVPLYGSRTLVVAPEFVDLPEGLKIANANYGVRLSVEGLAVLLNSLRENEILVQVSLENGIVGYAQYPVTVDVPNGISIDFPRDFLVLLESELNSDN